MTEQRWTVLTKNQSRHQHTGKTEDLGTAIHAKDVSFDDALMMFTLLLSEAMCEPIVQEDGSRYVYFYSYHLDSVRTYAVIMRPSIGEQP